MDSQESSPKQMFSIPTIRCASCVNKIENALQRISGISHCSVNISTKTAEVRGQVTPGEIINAIQAAGYDANLIRDIPDQLSATESAYLKKKTYQLNVFNFLEMNSKVVKEIIFSIQNLQKLFWMIHPWIKLSLSKDFFSFFGAGL